MLGGSSGIGKELVKLLIGKYKNVKVVILDRLAPEELGKIRVSS